MPDWLIDSLRVAEGLSPWRLAGRLLLALLFGVLVALIYRVSHGRNKPDASAMGATLVLLSVLIAMVSMVIGDSVARAFGLVGVLSIVRFRTVVDDTRDTAFVIFAVIVGMAAGVGQMWVAVVGIPVVGFAAVGFQLMARSGANGGSPEATLTVRLGLGRSPEELLTGPLTKHTERCRLTASSTARQGSAFDVTYVVRLKTEAAMTQLVSELNQIEGVQSVELKRT